MAHMNRIDAHRAKPRLYRLITKRLKLRRPVYRETADYGHLGREGDGFTWELTDYVDKLKSNLS